MKVSDNILLIINPISGDSDKEQVIKQVQMRVREQSGNLEIYRTTGDNDQEKITKVLNQFEAHRVLVAGGDGTIKLTAEVLRNHSVPIGILPSGSANGLAYNLKIPEAPGEALDIALSDHFWEIDALCINNDLCLHVSDLGLNAELIRNYEEGKVRGKLGYVLQSVPTLVKSDMPFSFEVSAEGQSLNRQGILLAIANARQYGTGATINPEGQLDDGKFEILIFKKLDFVEIFKTLGEDIELDSDFVESISTTHAEVHCHQPVPFQIDGEYYGEVDHIDVSILPKDIKVAVGDRKNRVKDALN